MIEAFIWWHRILVGLFVWLPFFLMREKFPVESVVYAIAIPIPAAVFILWTVYEALKEKAA